MQASMNLVTSRAYATLWTADWYYAREPSELKTFQMLARPLKQILQIWLASKSATAFTLTHLLPDHPFWDLGDFDWISMNPRSPLEESILDASLLPSRLSTLKDVPKEEWREKKKINNANTRARRERDGTKDAHNEERNRKRREQARQDRIDAVDEGVPVQVIIDRRKAARSAGINQRIVEQTAQAAAIAKQQAVLDSVGRKGGKGRKSAKPVVTDPAFPFIATRDAAVASGSGARAAHHPVRVENELPMLDQFGIAAGPAPPSAQSLSQSSPLSPPTVRRRGRARPVYAPAPIDFGSDDDDRDYQLALELAAHSDGSDFDIAQAEDSFEVDEFAGEDDEC